MTKQGKSKRKQFKGFRVSRNRAMDSTLGATPIYVRTFRTVGGVRPGCKFTKKANNKARRAGYPDAAAMAAALVKAVS